jgi:8-oxo-dGTP pyrophosphatase MutT (NUDIX family)
MVDKLLNTLKTRLQLPLPGKEAQYLLAPSYRSGMNEDGPRKKAGVILLLYLKNNELHFPLIERPVYNGAHSGQISFPGGQVDPADKNLTETSLRECEEEIGLKASKIEVIGELTSLFIPASKFEVFPIIGFYRETPSFIPQKEEVASIIEVPLSLLLSESCIEYKKVEFNGLEESIPFYNIYNKMVWGATAMMLSEFVCIWKENPAYSTRFL